MKIIIKANDANLKTFGNQLAALGSGQAHKALARAINRTTTTIHGRVIRAIRKQSDIPTAIIRRQIKKRLAPTNIAHGGVLEGVISATGSPISLKEFRARQFAFGVKAKWGGRWHEYQSAFMGPRPGVIAPKLGSNVFVRVTKDRFPLEMLFGPSVPEELIKGESERIFQETMATMLPQRVRHELGRLLP